MIETVIVFGAITGGMLALLALGFTLIYGVVDVVNMAHGALFMLGAYTFSVLTKFMEVSFGRYFVIGPYQLDILFFVLILTVVFVGIVGGIIYRLTIHPVIDDMVATLVITVGVALIVQEIVVYEFGSSRLSVESFVSGFIILLGVKVTYPRLIAFLASLAFFGVLWMLITKTKIGSAMRAVSQDREMAMLVGINTERLSMLTMALSSSLAALAGVLIAPARGGAFPQMWVDPLYMSFAIVILGGLGSIKGTIIGAFIVAFAGETFAYLAPDIEFLRSAVALAVMVLVLLVRPKGLFGKRIELEE